MYLLPSESVSTTLLPRLNSFRSQNTSQLLVCGYPSLWPATYTFASRCQGKLVPLRCSVPSCSADLSPAVPVYTGTFCTRLMLGMVSSMVVSCFGGGEPASSP